MPSCDNHDDDGGELEKIARVRLNFEAFSEFIRTLRKVSGMTEKQNYQTTRNVGVT